MAADKGDAAARALLHRSAQLLGNGLAALVSVFNPDLVVLGGGMARAREHLIAAIREAIYRRALPAATQDLRIEPSAVDMEVAGLIGAVQFAIDEIFAPDHLPQWLDQRSPAGRPDVAELPRAQRSPPDPVAAASVPSMSGISNLHPFRSIDFFRRPAEVCGRGHGSSRGTANPEEATDGRAGRLRSSPLIAGDGGPSSTASST